MVVPSNNLVPKDGRAHVEKEAGKLHVPPNQVPLPVIIITRALLEVGVENARAPTEQYTLSAINLGVNWHATVELSPKVVPEGMQPRMEKKGGRSSVRDTILQGEQLATF